MTDNQLYVLLVEDDALLAQALAARVAALGVEPRLVASRAEALAAAAGASVALVDLGLPPRPDVPDEGLLLIETLSLQQPQMVIVVQSGQEEERAAFAALAAGAWDYLAKPVAPQQFDAVLQRALRRARHARALASAGYYLPGGPALRPQGLKETGDAAQERLLRQTLAACGFNVAATARRLGLPRERLYYYLDKFGIRRPEHD